MLPRHVREPPVCMLHPSPTDRYNSNCNEWNLRQKRPVNCPAKLLSDYIARMKIRISERQNNFFSKIKNISNKRIMIGWMLSEKRGIKWIHVKVVVFGESPMAGNVKIHVAPGVRLIAIAASQGRGWVNEIPWLSVRIFGRCT